jgi:hypothetical protein
MKHKIIFWFVSAVLAVIPKSLSKQVATNILDDFNNQPLRRTVSNSTKIARYLILLEKYANQTVK